ncbi:hypothetical protein OHB41_24865 [Streptomyces sp. NBC_01571]|uniref:hypothetical protein n=1 Tax=Streptomyces sp. NBC_01571 TaxID=2975883 RepID=UPI002257D124|nr:hypothetical protein [Streptomyces sp. NBC_01571]MCX4576349.1 hypothetical protein [Streptomyces sp. NBC_01571]
MAHTAHASSASGTRQTARTPRPSDIFDARTHAVAQWAVPVLGGLVYGFWAAAVNRSGGPITGWNILFGFVSAIVFAAVCIGVLKVAPLMRRERHAVLWAVFAGVAFGFIYSQADHSVWRSTMMSLAVAFGVFAVNFYRYYTHEDGAGHRVG